MTPAIVARMNLHELATELGTTTTDLMRRLELTRENNDPAAPLAPRVETLFRMTLMSQAAGGR